MNDKNDWSPDKLYPEPNSIQVSHFSGEERQRIDKIKKQNNSVSPDFISNFTKQVEREQRTASDTGHKKQRFTFSSITLNGSSEQMEKQMLKDVYVLDGIALLGQSTVIYGSPNFGKTLIVIWLIIDAIKKGNFRPDNLMYINADDSHKGLTLKLRLAEQYGFHMTAPGYNNFRACNLTEMLRDFVAFDEARGKIIVLDTLKKFTDLMDKKAGSEFGVIAREFTARGGTLISLAHVNKHKNVDGKSVMAGTTDISDDADCVFVGDVVSDTNEKIVELRNTKDRGDIQKKISFSYDQTEKDYFRLLDTVHKMDIDEAELRRKADQNTVFIRDNQRIISYIKELIYSGVNSQKEILTLVNEMHNCSQKKTRAILNTLTGNSQDDGKLWTYSAVSKNRYVYRLLSKYEDRQMKKCAS